MVAGREQGESTCIASSALGRVVGWLLELIMGARGPQGMLGVIEAKGTPPQHTPWIHRRAFEWMSRLDVPGGP